MSEILEAACHEKLCSRKLQEANGDDIKWEREKKISSERGTKLGVKCTIVGRGRLNSNPRSHL